VVEEFGKQEARPPSSGYEFDLCLIGSGAAGIALARRLLPTGARIGLIESGGRDFDRKTQQLSDGESGGLDYYDLNHVNLRFFGGATAVWGGRCAQLDPVDFERRPWIPHSGWPFSKAELESRYREALGVFDLPYMAGAEAPVRLDRRELRGDYWQIDERFDRFGWANAKDLREAVNVRVLLGATATRLHADRVGGRIDWAEIASLSGRRNRVRARAFVLCSGGIETPRLLLASRQPGWEEGLGNRGGALGRFFMEHPHGRGARVFAPDPARLFRELPRFFERDGCRCGTLYRPGEDLQRSEGILNTGFTLAVRRHPGGRQELHKSAYNRLRHEIEPNRLGRGLWKATRRLSLWTQKRLERRLALRKLRQPEYGIYAILRAEQAPNPESRLTLTGRRDALGVPRVRLDWRLDELDKRSALEAMRALDRELRRLGLGRAEPEPWLADPEQPWVFDPLASNHAYGGYHHMGAARMAESERQGVCDPQCRVHGLENLFLAGSAVFPTGGWANPTLTIVALALRLGERLERELKALPLPEPYPGEELEGAVVVE